MTAMRVGALLIAFVALASAVVIVIRGLTAGSSQEVARPDSDGVVSVEMEGYRFRPAVLALPVDRPLAIRLTNHDDVVHEVSFGRTAEEEDAQGFVEDLFAGLDADVTPRNAQVGPSSAYPNFTLFVRPGATVTVDVTLPRDRVGTWEVGCFTAAGCHYRAGLSATVEVIDN